MPTQVEAAHEDMGVFNDLLGVGSQGYQKADSVRAKGGMGFDSMGKSSGLISPFENATTENFLDGMTFTDINSRIKEHDIPWFD